MAVHMTNGFPQYLDDAIETIQEVEAVGDTTGAWCNAGVREAAVKAYRIAIAEGITGVVPAGTTNALSDDGKYAAAVARKAASKARDEEDAEADAADAAFAATL